MFRKILVTAAVAFTATQSANAGVKLNGPRLNTGFLNGPVLNGVAADTQAFKVIAIELAPEVAAAE